MENRFLEMDDQLKRISGKRGRHCDAPTSRGSLGYAGPRNGLASGQSLFGQQLSVADRVLVILIENGGVDPGIPALVDKLFLLVPGADIIPDSYRQKLVDYLRQKITSFTDNLLETAELTINRYAAAKPDFFSDVVVLRDGTASYDDLKNKLLALARDNKVVDLLILTHGADDFISVTGGINGQKIRDMKTANGKPLTIRSVYMMNCVGSSLNQAWLDAGAKASSGAMKNNYLPEPTTFFFWKNWKDGQTFENAVTGAYRKTINLMNEAVRTFVRELPIPGAEALAGLIDFENLDFVKDSAPVIQGQRSVTINSDDLTFAESISSGLATTVLPVSLLRSLAISRSASDSERQPGTLSPQGVDFIKGFEGFRPQLYNDPVGHCTVGYGTLVHKGKCDGRDSEQPYADGVSEQRATELLAQEAAEFQKLINDKVTVPLNQNQNDALVSFVYNVGGSNFKNSTLLRLLNQGNYEAVPTELNKWTKARQDGKLVVLPGLVRRRAAEAELFQGSIQAAAQSLSSAHYARSFSSIDYSIPGTLPIIAQPTPNTCWAAVFTMMYSWKTNSTIAIRDALATVGPKYVDMFDKDIGLDTASAKVLYDDCGLVPIYSFNPTIEGWSSLLKQFGPLYVDVGYNAQNAGTHAIIVRGIFGDGSPENTSTTYVDPAEGKSFTLNFKDFLAKYEAQSGVRWPYTIVHWPAGPGSMPSSLSVTNSSCFESPSRMVTAQSDYSLAQNPAVAVIAGMEVGDALQVGLAAVSIVQTQVSASQGAFSLSYDKAQRLLTTEARAQMPGSQTSKKSYSLHLLYIGSDNPIIDFAKADVIIEWEGNPYGEIGTPIIRRNLSTSTEWSKSSANTTITKVDRIPLPKTDPRTWPIVYTYEGTFDPAANGYFEFSGEFEINAFGGLKFNRHEVVSRSLLDFAIAGSPADYVRRGRDVIVPVPAVPQEQIDYLRTRLP